jgi:hypothetical protein
MQLETRKLLLDMFIGDNSRTTVVAFQFDLRITTEVFPMTLSELTIWLFSKSTFIILP